MDSSPAPASTRFSNLPPDIIESHILTCLDGPALASATCCSTTLCHCSSQEYLWSNICHSTWPSTTSPRVSQVIAGFPCGGPRAFFSHAFPLLPELCLSHSSPAQPPELLSAVDIHHEGKLIFTKMQVTKTNTEWFRCSPFRIDLLEHKDAVSVPINHPDGEITAVEGITLSWILIDPIGGRAANLSSHDPVTVQRHWLTGEVEVRFASIVTTGQGYVLCRIVVTCCGGGGGGGGCGSSSKGTMQVKEVRLEIEDMDGKHLNGKESLEILQAAMAAKKGRGKRRAAEARRRYGEFEEMKRERRERKERREGALDTLCAAFGVLIFAAFLVLVCM